MWSKWTQFCVEISDQANMVEVIRQTWSKLGNHVVLQGQYQHESVIRQNRSKPHQIDSPDFDYVRDTTYHCMCILTSIPLSLGPNACQPRAKGKK